MPVKRKVSLKATFCIIRLKVAAKVLRFVPRPPSNDSEITVFAFFKIL